MAGQQNGISAAGNVHPSRIRLSIVAPCYNEEGAIEEFHRRMSAAAKDAVGDDYELILLNDGSSDRTWSIMRDLVATNPHLIAINLARRHGHQLAITAGLHMCRGDLILTIDADLQDPPELLGEMWRLMECNSSEVVYGVRRSRKGEGLLKRGTAAAFYRIMQRASPTVLPVDAGDFRLMTRRVLDILNRMPEQHRYIRGMVGWIGLRQSPFLYDRDPRFAGASNYSSLAMIRLALDAITSFSTVPLRIASYVGMLLGLLSILALSYTLGSWFLGHVVEGWTSVLTIILLLGSAQLILFGILGDYVGRLYVEAKHRPLFIIDQVIGDEAVQSVAAATQVSTAARPLPALRHLDLSPHCVGVTVSMISSSSSPSSTALAETTAQRR
jgi:polyisoprenyl-phosphate glycosyltransferase